MNYNSLNKYSLNIKWEKNLSYTNCSTSRFAFIEQLKLKKYSLFHKNLPFSSLYPQLITVGSYGSD